MLFTRLTRQAREEVARMLEERLSGPLPVPLNGTTVMRWGAGVWEWQYPRTNSFPVEIHHGLGVVPTIVMVSTGAVENEDDPEVVLGEAHPRDADVFVTQGHVVISGRRPHRHSRVFHWLAIGVADAPD